MKELIKDVKRDFLLIAIAGFVLGILVLLYPEGSGLIVCYICAGAVTVFGVLHIVSYFVNHSPEFIFRYDLAQGIIGLVLGIFLFARPELLLVILPMVFGVVVIVDSVIKLQNAFDYARMGYRFWWVVLILAAGTGVMGVLMLTNPFATSIILFRFIGVSLVVNALIDFWNVFYLSRQIKRVKSTVVNAAREAKAIEAESSVVDDTTNP